MLSIEYGKSHAFCDGVTRRRFLQIGCAAGLSLDRLLRLEATAAAPARDRSVVMVYLPGGPTQFETFDPKPNAAVDIRGSFGPISTSVPGESFCEMLPLLSAQADRFSVVRTLVGMQNRHESFQCYTGRPGGHPADNEPAGGWPSLGCVVSKLQGPGTNGMVPYIDAAPKMGHRPYNNYGYHDPAGKRSWPGFTGPEHVSFAIEGEGKADLVLNGIDADRLDVRRSLLDQITRVQSRTTGLQRDEFVDQAFGILTSSQLAEAMDVEREPQSVRELYGPDRKTDPSFGGAPQSPMRFLLARRLVEAGVRCVTLAFGAWDWHANREGTIEYLSRKYLPVFDHTLSVFLNDLHERGLLETTSVVVLGEFGRTPRINAKGGRDHWPNTQSILLAGGGIQGGRVIGTTDKTGGVPVDRPVHIQEVFATLYRNLGIDVNQTKIEDMNGRPRYLVENNRQPIAELY